MSDSTIFAPDSPLTYFALAIPGFGDIVEAKMESNLRKLRTSLLYNTEIKTPTAENIVARFDENQKAIALKVDRVLRIYDVLKIFRSALTLALVIVGFVCPLFAGMGIAVCILQAAPALIATVIRVYYRSEMAESEQKETFGYFLACGSKAALFYMFSKSIPLISLVYESAHLAYSVAKLGSRQYNHYKEKKAAPTFEKLVAEKLSLAEEGSLLAVGARKAQAMLEAKSAEGAKSPEDELNCSAVSPEARKGWMEETLRRRDILETAEFMELSETTLNTGKANRTFWVAEHPRLRELLKVEEQIPLVFLMKRDASYSQQLRELHEFDVEQKKILDEFKWVLNKEKLKAVREEVERRMRSSGSFLYPDQGSNPQHVHWARIFVETDQIEKSYQELEEKVKAAGCGDNEEAWKRWLQETYLLRLNSLKVEVESKRITHEVALPVELDESDRAAALKELEETKGYVIWLTADASEPEVQSYNRGKEMVSGSLKYLLCIPEFRRAIAHLAPRSGVASDLLLRLAPAQSDVITWV